MTVTSGAPQPARGSHRWDPVEMTEAEKLAAQREAQHDLAARGRRPAQENLQHYLAHERLAHGPAVRRATAARPAPAPP
ncbi:hypothetical protein, partial [Blastococcus sp. TF02A-35]|uniref:hypothetical protein n=1 Tax=Blastococcus sp. TF02A-35 TaxID=2559612 RepID=UPI0010733454